MIERQIKNLIDAFVENSLIENEEREQYVYSVTCLVESAITICSLFLLGILMETLIPCISFCIFFFGLRSRTGGFHIKTDGTSMAAPHVAGVASVLWAKDRSKSSAFIRALLNASAKDIGDEKKTGSGIVDLDYALTVYDEFAANYVEDAEEVNEGIVEENTAEVESYEDAEVNASWNSDSHAEAVGAYDQTSESALAVMKKGAKIPDSKDYMEFPNKRDTGKFHGHGNYVASYIYVMRMARKCYNSGMTEALKTKHPLGNTDDPILIGIKELNKDWNSVLSGYPVNNANKARVLVGIASHIAMDAYAHKAYRKSGGNWVKISDSKDQDSTTYVPSRWSTAKDVACAIIDVWHYGRKPSAKEFYQKSHTSSKFKLEKFKTNVKDADSSTYNSKSSWYDARSYNKK